MEGTQRRRLWENFRRQKCQVSEGLLRETESGESKVTGKVSGVSGCADAGVTTRTGNTRGRAGLGKGQNGKMSSVRHKYSLASWVITGGRYLVRNNQK